MCNHFCDWRFVRGIAFTFGDFTSDLPNTTVISCGNCQPQKRLHIAMRKNEKCQRGRKGSSFVNSFECVAC